MNIGGTELSQCEHWRIELRQIKSVHIDCEHCHASKFQQLKAELSGEKTTDEICWFSEHLGIWLKPLFTRSLHFLCVLLDNI